MTVARWPYGKTYAPSFLPKEQAAVYEEPKVKQVAACEMDLGEYSEEDPYAPGIKAYYADVPVPVGKPKAKKPVKDDPLRKAVDHYLRNYGASLFGRPFEIPEKIEAAKDFVIGIIEGVLKAAEELKEQ